MTQAQRIDAAIASVAPALEQIPGVAIIHHIFQFNVIYMSRRGLSLLHTTLDELKNLDAQYHNKYFNEEDAKDYVPKLSAMLERNDSDEMISFFQQVRTGASGSWQWYLSSIKVFMRDDDGKPLLTLTIAIPIDPEHHITNKVERLLDENNTLRRSGHLLGQLTRREREIVALMAKDHSSQEIAKSLFLSEETVKTHRRNINRKLGVENYYELVRFAQAFDLI